jgi:bacterioferritin-associated ferredoxin
MYVCICNAVTDTEIQQCAEGGARTLADLRDQLGVATNCGQCAQSARGILRAHRDQSCTPKPYNLVSAA